MHLLGTPGSPCACGALSAPTPGPLFQGHHRSQVSRVFFSRGFLWLERSPSGFSRGAPLSLPSHTSTSCLHKKNRCHLTNSEPFLQLCPSNLGSTMSQTMTLRDLLRPSEPHFSSLVLDWQRAPGQGRCPSVYRGIQAPGLSSRLC